MALTSVSELQTLIHEHITRTPRLPEIEYIPVAQSIGRVLAEDMEFSMLIASSITGLAWACWHTPLWFYDRFYDRSQDPFLVFIIVSIFQSIWFAALHKKTKSVLA